MRFWSYENAYIWNRISVDRALFNQRQLANGFPKYEIK